MRTNRHVPSVHFTHEVNGKTYAGWYKVERGMIEVSNGEGTKRTHAPRSDYEAFAKRLLAELIREGRA